MFDGTTLLGSIEVPPYLAVSSGLLRDEAPVLTPGEQATIRPMSTARLAEFAQGRMHARIALTRLGLASASIPVAADRSPVWPQGFVGSISHVPPDPARRLPGQVIAVAARSADCAGLGVDLERIGSLAPEHWSAFMTKRELAWIATRPVVQRSWLAHGLWSAKEAVMKALCRPLEPQDIEVSMGEDTGTFFAECCLADVVSDTHSVSLNGWLTHTEGWVVALAIVPSTRLPVPVAPASELGNRT